MTNSDSNILKLIARCTKLENQVRSLQAGMAALQQAQSSSAGLVGFGSGGGGGGGIYRVISGVFGLGAYADSPFSDIQQLTDGAWGGSFGGLVFNGTPDEVPPEVMMLLVPLGDGSGNFAVVSASCNLTT